MDKITYKDLWQIEEALNSIHFSKVPVGFLLSSYLSLGLMHRQFDDKGFLAGIINYLKVYKRKRQPLSYLTSSPEEIKAKWPDNFENAILVYSKRSNMWAMSLGVASQFKKNSNFMILLNGDLDKMVPNIKDYPYLKYEDLMRIDYMAWREQFSSIENDLRRVLKNLRTQYNWGWHVSLQMKDAVIIQTQFLASFLALFEVLNVKRVIAPYDRFSSNAPAVLAAKKFGLPTYTLVHGEIQNPFGYVPILADKLFAWGDRQKQVLISHGADPAKVEATGAPQLGLGPLPVALPIRERLNIKREKVFVFGSSLIEEPWRTKSVAGFCEAVASMPDAVGLVKLHPAERPEHYNKLRKMYSEIRWLSSTELSLPESLSVSDAMVVYSSAIGFDALLHGVPLVIYNVSDSRLGNMRAYSQEGGVLMAGTPDELRDYLLNTNNRIDQGRLQTYIKSYCMATGNQASKNVVSAIRKHEKANLIPLN